MGSSEEEEKERTKEKREDEWLNCPSERTAKVKERTSTGGEDWSEESEDRTTGENPADTSFLETGENKEQAL